MRRLGLALAVLVACSTQKSPSNAPPPPASVAAVAPPPTTVTDASSTAVADAAPPSDVEPDPAERDRGIPELRRILFGEKDSPANCTESDPFDAHVRCLYDERYKGDPKAAHLAYEMLVRWKIVAGVEVPHTMDGGYRGMIQLVPHVPTGDDRKHLEWAVAAFSDMEKFFAELDAYGREHGAGSAQENKKKPYRFRGIEYRFTRSVNVNRPSAYAHDWTIGYNVRGSINLNAEMVRETLFHEIFHLNDPVHGSDAAHWWSFDTLSKTFDAIVKKCGVQTPCLTPYTPNETMVRGGTYYSFQPGNGVAEYAAELALRYYREQRAHLRNLPNKPKPFKCGPKENADSWDAMKNEFFRGIDAVPPC